MILVTVGTQLPFDRLIRAIDMLAPSLDRPVVAQTGCGTYRPEHIRHQSTFAPGDFDRTMDEADLIVAHAGIGTILMAQKRLKPIILFPRRAAFGEHRNDHQMATVAALEGRQGIYIARTEEALADLLRQRLAPPVFQAVNLDVERLRGTIVDYIKDI